jgi:hypothetical protein
LEIHIHDIGISVKQKIKKKSLAPGRQQEKGGWHLVGGGWE